LAEFYNKHHENKNLEIIFISSDRDEDSFVKYYFEMPWFTLDYKERKKKEELGKKFEITGIPTLILLDGDSGDIICKDARNEIQEKDPQAKNFPWK
jgi:nucleoredoxin